MPAATQTVNLGAGNGPQEQLAYGFNTAGLHNVVSYNNQTEVLVVTLPGVPFAKIGFRSVIVGAVGSSRCAVSYAPILSLQRIVVARCRDILGFPLKAPVTVMDADILICALC